MKQVNLLSVISIFNVVLPALLIALLFVTPFVVSDKIYNGVIAAKEFWFFGVVAAMLLYSGIRLLFKRSSVKISLNLTDILLLAFYAWCFLRAIFTPYTPFWHNHKLQVLTGMMVVYFFVKNTIKNERNEGNEGNEKNEKIERIKNNEENENNERNEKIKKKGILSLFHSFILSLNSPSFFHYFIPSLISLLFCALISFPFYSISILVLLFILISIITIHHKAVLVIPTHQLPMRLSLAVLLFVFSVSQLSILQKIPGYSKWNEANGLYFISNYQEANSAYLEIIPSLAYEGPLWQQFGKSLQMNENNEEAAKVLEKAGLFTSDYILYAALGDAYKGAGQYAKAESAYQQASFMEPNKLYPLYLLAKLYDESGQRQKAIETAAGLLDKNIKVHSTAIEEIKTEMNKILSKYNNWY